MQATLPEVGLAVERLPDGAVWSGAGLGDFQLTAQSLAVAAGGGVRVGLEDGIWFDRARTRLATNPMLVERVQELLAVHDRAPMTPDELRGPARRSGVTVPFAAPTRLAPAEAADVRARRRAGPRDGDPWIAGRAGRRPSSATSRRTSVPARPGGGRRRQRHRRAGRSRSARSACGPGSAVLVADDEGGYAATAAGQLGLRAAGHGRRPGPSMGPTAQTPRQRPMPRTSPRRGHAPPRRRGAADAGARRLAPRRGDCCWSRTAPRPTACGSPAQRTSA